MCVREQSDKLVDLTFTVPMILQVLGPDNFQIVSKLDTFRMFQMPSLVMFEQ